MHGHGVGEDGVPVLFVAVTPAGQSGDVSVRLPGKGEAHRRQVPRCDSASAENRQDQCSADAPVAVVEGVNRLELCVRDRRLNHGGNVLSVAECAQIVQQLGNELVRRRDELCVAWARRGAADPVLFFADPPAEVVVAGAGEEEAMDVEQMVARKLVDVACESDGALERGDVGEDALGCEGSRILRESSFSETSMRKHETLDARRGDRLGPEKLTRNRLEVDESRGVFVQLAAGLLCVRGRGGDVRAEQEVVVCDRRWDVGLIREAAPGAAAAKGSWACFPAEVDQAASLWPGSAGRDSP